VAESAPAHVPPPPTEAVPAAAPPLFRARQDLPKAADQPSAFAIPAVIPIVRAPDDPGIDDESEADEFAERIAPAQGQAGGWRGFLSRWGG
jgi:HemY protein